MTAPLVTIVVPCFQHGHLISRALHSVAQQRAATDIELIVVDDASTDDTGDVLRRSPVTIDRVITHPHNRGATAAKNSGIAAAHGEWIGVLDSDDWLLEGALQSLLALLETDDSPEAVGSLLGWCVDPHTGVRTGRAPVLQGELAYRSVLCGELAGEFWGLTRRTALAGTSFDETLPGGSESLVWWDVYRRTRTLLSSAVVRAYDRGASGQSSAAMTLGQAEAIARKYGAIVDIYGEDLAAECPRRFRYYYRRWKLFERLSGKSAASSIKAHGPFGFVLYATPLPVLHRLARLYFSRQTRLSRFRSRDLTATLVPEHKRGP